MTSHNAREPVEAIPADIRQIAYKLGSDIRHHIAHSEIELIQHDAAVDEMIAKAIHDAVMAERERCAGIARAEYEKRFDNRDDYPAARVHDFLVVAVAIGKGIKADFNRAPKTEG